MASESGFRVLIAGGGVAGLTLANMLERAGIDYNLLEAHGAIAPPVGASIGLFPNGLRVLDQLGVYETIRTAWGHHPMSNCVRTPTGEVVYSSPAMGDHLERRHGYGFIFIDRQRLLQILYDNLRQKDRVRLNTRVVDVEMTDTEVRVTTSGKEQIVGHVLVGADGIHSRVRSEMWRIGTMEIPGSFKKDIQTCIPYEYECVFGISEVDHPLDSNHFVCGEGYSYLLSPGPGHRMYWFLFSRIDDDKRGQGVPKCTKEDEVILVEKHMNDVVTERYTFGDLYRTRETSTLTPLAEHVFHRWYFGRIITIGDSAHKMNPIAGQGGMLAIEAAATFMNELSESLRRKRSKPLANGDFNSIFARVQASCVGRAKALVKNAKSQQMVQANGHPIAPILVFLLGYVGGLDFDLTQVAKRVLRGASLRDVPIPKRPRLIPFIDELPARPISRLWMTKILFAGITSLYFYQSVTESQGVVDNGAEGQKRHWLLSVLGLLRTDMPFLTIWAIEGQRKGSSMSLLRWPILFAALHHFKGVDFTTSLYVTFSIIWGSNAIVGRPVPQNTAHMIPVTMSIGYAGLVALRRDPWLRELLIQNVAENWISACLLIAGAVIGGSAVRRRIVLLYKGGKNSGTKPQDESFNVYNNGDVGYLKATYALIFGTSAVAAICMIVLPYMQPGLVTGGVPTRLFEANVDATTCIGREAVKASHCILILCLHTVVDLRRQGYITTTKSLTTTAAALVCQLILGPGPAYAALWLWREALLASLSH